MPRLRVDSWNVNAKGAYSVNDAMGPNNTAPHCGAVGGWLSVNANGCPGVSYSGPRERLYRWDSNHTDILDDLGRMCTYEMAWDIPLSWSESLTNLGARYYGVATKALWDVSWQVDETVEFTGAITEPTASGQHASTSATRYGTQVVGPTSAKMTAVFGMSGRWGTFMNQQTGGFGLVDANGIGPGWANDNAIGLFSFR